MMTDSKLFSPFQLGSMNLANRAVMAPMTRCRASNPALAPTPMMVEYYVQRASAGLIISEGVPVSRQARGYAFTPGLYSPEQVAGWKGVTAAVHQGGSRIFAQLWHCGRVSHASLREDHSAPVGPSALASQSKAMGLNRGTGEAGQMACDAPRALATAEVKLVIADFVQAARNAIEAGFDGVEIHGANGYLLDQFRCPYVNDRRDEYGGSLENRCRLHLDCTRAVAAAIGAQRVGMRISPLGQANDMKPDPDPIQTYGYLARELDAVGIAYLHVNDQSATWIHEVDNDLLRVLRKDFSRALTLAAGCADLIAFGKPFISNPDLVERMRTGVEIAPWDSKTFYLGGISGYLDYPTFAA
jgi:N-ethylmaleimide reductase